MKLLYLYNTVFKNIYLVRGNIIPNYTINNSQLFSNLLDSIIQTLNQRNLLLLCYK